MNTVGTVNSQPASGCMEKSSCKWPVIIGVIVGSVVALVALACTIRCCCRRRRRRRRRTIRSTNYIDSSRLQISAPILLPAAEPPAYDSPKLAVGDFNQKRWTTKDDPLPPLPVEDVPLKKKGSDQDYDQGMELDKLKRASTQSQPVSTLQVAQPVDGLIPLRNIPSKNPFEAPAETKKSPFDASSLGENRDYNPISPVSPQRSYSPFSPSNYTRYATSPSSDQPSRQSLPFSSAASMKSISYVPPPSPYLAYSSSTAMPQSSSLLDEAKTPYRAYSPRLVPRYEFSAPTPPPASSASPSEPVQRNISPLNHEPLELGTSYNTRPQSMLLEGHSYRGRLNHPIGELPSEEKASIPREGSEQKPIDLTPHSTPTQPHENRLEIPTALPQELPTRNSTYGEAALPASNPASTDPPEPVRPPADLSPRTLPAGIYRGKNPFRTHRPS